MTDIALIAGAATSPNTALNLSKTLLGIRDAAGLQAKVIELQGEIMSAQSATFAAQSGQLTLLERIRELEAQVTKLKARNAQKQRYVLQEPVRGKFVYALKENRCGPEPMHWVCTACYDDGHKSIIQLTNATGEGDHYRCPRCKHSFYIPAPARTVRVMAN